jgi:hypothetical protein
LRRAKALEPDHSSAGGCAAGVGGPRPREFRAGPWKPPKPCPGEGDDQGADSEVERERPPGARVTHP